MLSYVFKLMSKNLLVAAAIVCFILAAVFLISGSLTPLSVFALTGLLLYALWDVQHKTKKTTDND